MGSPTPTPTEGQFEAIDIAVRSDGAIVLGFGEIDVDLAREDAVRLMMGLGAALCTPPIPATETGLAVVDGPPVVAIQVP